MHIGYNKPVHQSTPEQPDQQSLPYMVRDHILREPGLQRSEREALRQTVAEFLSEGLLVFDAPDALTPEQQEHSTTFPRTQNVLALGEQLVAQPEATRNLILSSLCIDWLLYGKRFDKREIKAQFAPGKQSNISSLARKVLYQLRHPGETYTTPAARVANEKVAACIGCIVGRGVAQAGVNINTASVRACSEVSPALFAAALEQLADGENPIVEKVHADTVASRNRYALTQAGMALKGTPRPGCTVELPKYARYARQQQTEQLNTFVQSYAADMNKAVRARLIKTMRQAIKTGVIQFSKTAGLPQEELEDTLECKQESVIIGPALSTEAEAVQQIVIYTMGLSRIVYGRTPAPEVLRTMLETLGHNSPAEVARLFWSQREQKMSQTIRGMEP